MRVSVIISVQLRVHPRCSHVSPVQSSLPLSITITSSAVSGGTLLTTWAIVSSSLRAENRSFQERSAEHLGLERAISQRWFVWQLKGTHSCLQRVSSLARDYHRRTGASKLRQIARWSHFDL